MDDEKNKRSLEEFKSWGARISAEYRRRRELKDYQQRALAEKIRFENPLLSGPLPDDRLLVNPEQDGQDAQILSFPSPKKPPKPEE